MIEFIAYLLLQTSIMTGSPSTLTQQESTAPAPQVSATASAPKPAPGVIGWDDKD